MIWFAGTRDRVKFPKLLAGASVIGTGVPGRPAGDFILIVEVFFARSEEIHADKDHVLIDGGDAGEWDIHRHFAFGAEAGIEFAGIGVEGDHLVSGSEDDARRIVLVARPV